MEDFVPRVSSISSHPLAKEEEEEEEEDEMVDLVHNFIARKRKRGATFMRAIVATPDVAGEASQQPLDESSDVQAKVVSDSPEMGFHGQSNSKTTPSMDSREVSPTGFRGQSASETAPLMDSGEVFPTYEEVREDIPSEQVTSRPDKAAFTQAGRSKSLLPNRLLLMNSYIPPHGQAPPMEEVSALGPEGSQEIINHWRPFNRGKSPIAHMHQLYPALLRMHVAMRAEGRGDSCHGRVSGIN